MAGLLAISIAAPASGETLQDALATAYMTNAQLQAERSQLEVTNEQVPQALSNWRPTVAITAQAGLARQWVQQSCNVAGDPCGNTQRFLTGQPVVSNLLTTNNLTPDAYGVTVTQPIFRGGQTVAQTAEALNLVRSERAHLTSVEETVLLTAVTDYLGVVEQSTIVDLSLNNEQVLRKQLDATEQRYRIGELTHTDVRLAEASYSQAVANRRAAEGQLAISRATYQHDIGQAPGALSAPTATPDLPANRDEATALAAAAAPSVVQAEYAQEAAENSVDAVRGQLLPSVTVQASVQRAHQNLTTQGQNTGGQRIDTGQIVGQATVPLYEGGLIYSQSRAAQKTVAFRKHQLDDARRFAVQTAAQAWDSLKATRDQIFALKQSVQANELALAGLEQEEQVGTRTVQDVLIQEQNLYQARVALVTAQHDELLARFDLSSAVGRLTARNLALPVQYYDPDQEFDAVRNKWIGFGTGP